MKLKFKNQLACIRVCNAQYIHRMSDDGSPPPKKKKEDEAFKTSGSLTFKSSQI